MSTSTDQPEPNPDPQPMPAEPIATTPEPGPATQTEPEARAVSTKPKVSPARNAVSMILLIVLLIVGGLELSALFRFNGAVARLDNALEANEDDLLSKEVVEEILGKRPDGPLQDDQPGMQSTTYTWRGAIRSHILTGYYSYGDEPGMVKYEIGSAEAIDPGGD